MRTIKKWDTLYPKYLKTFTPRIQRDLQVINLPNVERVTESAFIYGEVATGKTLLAAQLTLEEMKYIYLNAIPNVHNTIIFISFPELLNKIKATYSNPNNKANNKDFDSTTTVINKYLGAHLLVIDDFITTKPTDWVMDILYYIINHRYEQLKKTIITCNHSLPQLEQILGDQRIPSRLSRGYKIIQKQMYKRC